MLQGTIEVPEAPDLIQDFKFPDLGEENRNELEKWKKILLALGFATELIHQIEWIEGLRPTDFMDILFPEDSENGEITLSTNISDFQYDIRENGLLIVGAGYIHHQQFLQKQFWVENENGLPAPAIQFYFYEDNTAKCSSLSDEWFSFEKGLLVNQELITFEGTWYEVYERLKQISLEISSNLKKLLISAPEPS